MQLYSVDQKRSQALEAHAAAFSTLKVCTPVQFARNYLTTLHSSDSLTNDLARPLQAPGSQTSSTVISFAQKTFANGVLTSKLHVIELGAAPGEPDIS